MRREWLLLSGSVVITLLVSLGLIRWLAPGLLGLSSDLQLVQIDKKVPPFYEGVFRRDDIQSKDFLLKDPLTRVRGRPFLKSSTGILGPHDILGFRNHRVLNVADVVTIGDSMTYGNNVRLEENWPSVLQQHLGSRKMDVYNMSTGGWAAVQYLDMFTNAVLFQPGVIVVAFYTGNDPVESFQAAYGIESWHWLIPDAALSKADLPRVEYPPPESAKWHVAFSNGEKIVLTPALRLASNMDNPAISAGYDIMARVAREISEQAGKLDIRVVFTIIPTKELVYARKIKLEGLDAPDDYTRLVKRETGNLQMLADVIRALPDAGYIDVLGPLQEAALSTPALYPPGDNGHPLTAGYRVIGDTIANAVDGLLPAVLKGGVAIRKVDGYLVMLVKDDGVWHFSSMDVVEKNGWSMDQIRLVQDRDISRLPYGGVIRDVDPERFGPMAVAGE